MLHPENLHKYQINMIRKQLSNNKSMLWVGTGCGKTIATLSSIAHLIKTKKVKRVIVIAPVRVLYSVWDNVESKKWSHTEHLRTTIIHGSAKERISALTNPDFDIYGVNYEGLTWLTAQLNKIWINRGKKLPFEMVVYDEITKNKSTKSIRWNGSRKEIFDPKGLPLKNEDGSQMLDENGIQMIDKKGLPLLDENGRPMIKVTEGWKKIAPLFKYRTGLTGTPSSNGEMDLFGQFLAIDDGKRLGKFITHFRKRFFTSDFMGYSYDLNAGASQAIKEAVQDITISVSAKKNLQLPDVMINDIYVDLPPKAMQHYRQIEDQLFTVLESGTEVELQGESGVYNKCLQICNGNMYTHQPLPDETVMPTWENIHKEKCQALDEILEEAAGTPVFSSYSYKMDADMIMNNFKKYKPVNITGVPPNEIMKIISNWDEGKTPLLIGHAASVSHGIDGLQNMGHIVVWFGMTYSLELYMQLNGRFDRQGQKNSVIIHRILCRGTIDEVVKDVIEAKFESQENLLDNMEDNDFVAVNQSSIMKDLLNQYKENRNK